MISAAHILWSSELRGHTHREHFEMIDAIWYVLMYMLMIFILTGASPGKPFFLFFNFSGGAQLRN